MTNVVEQAAAARPVTPLGILAEQLESIVQEVNKQTGVSAELKAKLNFAWRLAAGLDPYLEECTTSESLALAALAKKTSVEAWTQRFDEGATVRPLEQEMLSGHVEGQTLKMFIHMTKAKRVLEIGMFTGYSALAMAEALPADGELVACEVDPYTAEFGKTVFRASPHGQKIRVEVGSALETLDKLAEAGESFDFVFIDADKKEYVQYFQTLLDKNLLKREGFICVDNTLLQGQVYLPVENRTANGEAIAQFNRVVAADKRVEQVLLPLRDGLTIIRRTCDVAPLGASP
ncbi:class I SAM-dependent methyltransferase [Aetokthonos hydrillicola Thurmond2011]|jgi:caffeoyl-CoA O-methyltransferase|uniref:Class I SAM-dependent methyltransferase n=1 Tax=Aetokthonos hydrillicola Thurmond2011 TaxID=2712845 RepID=A0AAP5MD04_9CYAN|nr:class I SAM-dependent methyltransferase [Aetokthonos hydrillicola]MBO3463232.1 SAM-dependent methyltransferase [Aetokthonos hydrillicola CCALA 1050]MBW4590705.1 class I SAM-dependent methyltransferase [Aetokthonos hydrillicola CCALA 1050]MDR9899837.1 class I SAM-dependent methyltransferase [Aetokthonos hydrillicola Thurmond2011]